jgi:hypothetical protein
MLATAATLMQQLARLVRRAAGQLKLSQIAKQQVVQQQSQQTKAQEQQQVAALAQNKAQQQQQQQHHHHHQAMSYPMAGLYQQLLFLCVACSQIGAHLWPGCMLI